MANDLGLYVSIPFCRSKCSFCNFASDRFPSGLLPRYVAAVAAELQGAPARAARFEADLPRTLASVYFGGGTPSLLEPGDIHVLFQAIYSVFQLSAGAELTIECAPGQIAPATLEAFLQHGVNRISFGVQSFNDREIAAVGRAHTGQQCRDEIARMQRAGLTDIGIDLIAGLPHQTELSWTASLAEAIDSGVSHVSVYLLEVDDESRLGREALAGGTRFGAAALPDDQLSVRFYELACDRLEAAGLSQYEISNFARAGFRSRHNQRYWSRKPYLGVGLDAHSMLWHGSGRGLRFANPDSMEPYLSSWSKAAGSLLPLLSPAAEPPHLLSTREELEETFFLGLRQVEGLSYERLAATFPSALLQEVAPVLAEARSDGLLIEDAATLRLTPLGRLLSNELFSRLLQTDSSVSAA